MVIELYDVAGLMLHCCVESMLPWLEQSIAQSLKSNNLPKELRPEEELLVQHVAFVCSQIVVSLGYISFSSNSCINTVARELALHHLLPQDILKVSYLSPQPQRILYISLT